MTLSNSNGTYDNPYLASNSQLRMQNSAGNRIPGTVSVYNTSNDQTLNIPQNTIIDGNLFYNGEAANGYVPHAEVDQPGGVLGDGRAGNGNAIIDNAAGPNTEPFIPVQTPTEIAYTDFNSMLSTNSSGQSTTRILTNVHSPSLGSIAQLPSITAPSTVNTSLEVTVNPGTYTTNALSIKGSDVMNINGDVQIFVQENNSPIDLSGGLNFNKGNLTIYYAGKFPLTLDLSKSAGGFKGQIYAPNANVSVNLAGHSFSGAISANTLTMNGDSNGGGSGSFDFSGNPKYLSSNRAFQRISWVETSN